MTMQDNNPNNEQNTPTPARGFISRMLSYFRQDVRPSSPEFCPIEVEADQYFQFMENKLSSPRNLPWLERCLAYDVMESFPLVATALDLYAEEATQPDSEQNKIFWIDANNPEIRDEINRLVGNLGLEELCFDWIRTIAQYGFCPVRLYYTPNKGIYCVEKKKPAEVTRIVRYGKVVGYKQKGVKFKRAVAERDESWPWDFACGIRTGNGTEGISSYLDAMYRPVQQLLRTENAILYYRMRRAPARNMIMLNAGTMTPAQQAELFQRAKNHMRTSESFDPITGMLKKVANTQSPLEDLLVVVADGDDTTRVDKLDGSGDMGNNDDLVNFRNMFFAAARIPRAFLGFEGEISARATLLTQDVRFARTIRSLRHAFIRMLRLMFDAHLTSIGFQLGLPANAYVIRMSPINTIDELERIEAVKSRLDVATSFANMADSFGVADKSAWVKYALKKFLLLPDADIKMLTTFAKPESPVDPTAREDEPKKPIPALDIDDESEEEENSFESIYRESTRQRPTDISDLTDSWLEETLDDKTIKTLVEDRDKLRSIQLHPVND